MPLTLDDFMKGETIAVVDIETTGFSHQKDCIVEISICELDLDSGECRELFNKIVRESHFSPQHRTAWIFKNSGLRYEDVLVAKPLNSYRKELQKIFYLNLATAYNKRFDFDFLQHRGFEIKELSCPMAIATDILKLLPKKIIPISCLYTNFSSSYSFPIFIPIKLIITDRHLSMLGLIETIFLQLGE